MTDSNPSPLQCWVLYNQKEELYYEYDGAGVWYDEPNAELNIVSIGLKPINLDTFIGMEDCYDSGEGTPIEGSMGLDACFLFSWRHDQADDLETYMITSEIDENNSRSSCGGGNLMYWEKHGFNPKEFILFPMWLYYEVRTVNTCPVTVTHKNKNMAFFTNNFEIEKEVGFVTDYEIDFTLDHIDLGVLLQKYLNGGLD